MLTISLVFYLIAFCSYVTIDYIYIYIFILKIYYRMGCVSTQKQARNQPDNNVQQVTMPKKIQKSNHQSLNIVTRQPNQSHISQIYPSVFDRPPHRQANSNHEILYQGAFNPEGRQEQASEVSSQISRALTQVENRRARINMNSQQSQSENQPGQRDEGIHQLQVLFYLFRLLRTQSTMSQEQNMILFIRLLQILGTAQQSQGLNRQQIRKLQIKTSKNNEEICSVCQDSMKYGQKIMELPCSHNFHPQCINPWLQKSDKCPMCRNSVRRRN